MIFSTRLARILRILLDHDEMYVSVDELASQLQTSRRTIFRELQHIDLSGYGLELLSRQGKGLQLSGSTAGKKKLADELTTRRPRIFLISTRKNEESFLPTNCSGFRK